MRRSNVAAQVLDRITARSSSLRGRYLAHVRRRVTNTDARTPRVGVIACAVAPGAQEEVVDRESAWVLRGLRDACSEAELLVRLPSSCHGFASSAEGARQRRNLASLNTSMALAQGASDLTIALRMGGEAAAGVLVACLRHGQRPLLCLPDMLEPSESSRDSFEMQVMLAALSLYDVPERRGDRLLRSTLHDVLRTPPPPLGEVLSERAFVNAALALLAIDAERARFYSLATIAHAAGVRFDRVDVSELEGALSPDLARGFDAPLPFESRPQAIVRTLRARGLFELARLEPATTFAASP